MKASGILEFTYFKDTGKYYACGELCIADEGGNIDLRFADCIYPKDFGRRALQLKMLPGLASGTWSGPFIVKDLYMELILPEEQSCQ